MTDKNTDKNKVHDAIVVGAGFGGMYMMHRLTEEGFDAIGFERGGDVGGTWYWNRYPGCQCDVESMEYSYQFSEDLQQEWVWTKRYAGQAEILDYANHVADQFNLRDNFTFNTSVNHITYDDDTRTWTVGTDQGHRVTARFVVMATGILSTTNTPDFPGVKDFGGDIYHTGTWPHDGVDFTGKKVAVIGTGSSGIQAIPLIAQQAADLTVFQRTPNYTIPAQNGPLDKKLEAKIKADYPAFRKISNASPAAFGATYKRGGGSALDATPEERQARFEEYWQHGGFAFLAAFDDISTNLDANAHAQDFVRSKIRDIVDDPAVAELLCPDTVIGCKRLCADTGYYATYNSPHVHLVDVSTHPIEKLTGTGLVTNGQAYDFDAIVFATGFDAVTGTLLNCNITGAHGTTLADKWADGPAMYLGLMTKDFPNLFTITGPGSPSALANLITGIEQHANFITDLIKWSDARGHKAIEATRQAELDWMGKVQTRMEASLYPYCNSWYVGANVPGKPRVFTPFLGFPDYTRALNKVVAEDYPGLAFA